MEITISKALSLKNRLAGQIADLRKKIQTYNIHQDGIEPPYNSLELLEELASHVSRLIAIKTAIATANIPILEKIYTLSEAKSMISTLKSLPVSESTTQVRDVVKGELEWVSVMMVASISAHEVDTRIAALETQTDELQEELDTFNHNTKISIPD